MDAQKNKRGALRKLAAGVAAAGAAAASYMTCEARWVQCGQKDLSVPGLPAAWSGLTVLHISDVHAGSFAGNDRNLERVVDWAQPLAPDLVFLTGDVLGVPQGSEPCLRLLDRLQPPLGAFAVSGNHEYGLSKAPLARPRDTKALWQEAGVTLLSDTCAALPARDDTTIVLCGADYLTGGYGLLKSANVPRRSDTHAFPILLIHDPPRVDSPLGELFPLAFAGHTHGGQLRVPGRSGLMPLHREEFDYLSGVHGWGQGQLVISRGLGASFLPFRLFTRPEATLWRLVYTATTTTVAEDS